MTDTQKQKAPLLRKARWYNDRNRTYKACRCYLQVIQQDPDALEAIEEISLLYYDRGDFEIAAICFEYLLLIYGVRQDILVRLAHCRFQESSFSEAKLVLSQPLDWDPLYHEERLLTLSQCELQLGEPLNALELLRDLNSSSPSPLYYLLQGEILESLSLHTAAIEVCRKGLQRDPYFDDLLVLKARLHLHLTEFEKARRIYLKMIQNHLFLGEARLDLEEYLAIHGPISEIYEILDYFDDTLDFE
ncbi:hypothetical protein HOF92_00515 [bacterium]|jgi:tetratricopeptide (TPR) repeat protein|nr:hypothetical protein [bacterium]